MKVKSIIVVVTAFMVMAIALSGCSTKEPRVEWQHESQSVISANPKPN